jgi:hydrogenase maturation protein HypF
VRLLEQSIGRLTGLGFSVYRHRIVPTNDGGISLGQAAIAAARWANRSRIDSKGV